MLKKQECWEGHEQALITTILKEAKQTEELKEAGYRSTTWAVLRVWQQINIATRIEGEAAMSAPPFFQSAGRGDSDLLFWGETEGPTVVIWESLSEQEKKSWLKSSARCTTGSCGANQKKVWKKSAHLSSAGICFTSTMKRNRKKKRTKRTGAKRRHIAGRAYDTGHCGSKATSKWQ